jgi:hypothetical protein
MHVQQEPFSFAHGWHGSYYYWVFQDQVKGYHGRGHLTGSSSCEDCQDGDHCTEGLSNGLESGSLSTYFQAAESNRLSKHLIVRLERRDCYCVQLVLQSKIGELRRVWTKGKYLGTDEKPEDKETSFDIVPKKTIDHKEQQNSYCNQWSVNINTNTNINQYQY